MHYVDDEATVAALCSDWLEATPVAVDTEFERSVTYFPRPALIQLCNDEQTWLIDPLAANDLAPLGRLLGAGGPTKLLHSALEDLTVLEIATGQAPGNVFDTQLAAAFAGIGFGLGYHALVKRLLDRDLNKDQTRSNWLRRPLSEAQLAYAVADVAHLHELHRILAARLEELGRAHWLTEETERLFARARGDETERDFLRLVRRAGPDDRVRGRLHALVAWREAQAMQRDRPRRHVVDDDLLVELARSTPANPGALRSLDSWAGHRGRASAAQLLEAVEGSRDASPLELPAEATAMEPFRGVLGEARGIVAGCAAREGLEPALLAPKRLLEKALVHVRILGRDGLPEEFTGWRAQLLGEPLLACLRDG